MHRLFEASQHDLVARDELVAEVSGKIYRVNGSIDFFLHDVTIWRLRSPLDFDFLLNCGKIVIQRVKFDLEQLVVRNFDDITETLLIHEHIFICADDDLFLSYSRNKLA